MWKLLLVFCFILSSCANRSNLAEGFAQRNNFHKQIIKTSTFKLTTYSRISEKGKPADIYIEGDGFAWASRNRLSTNPTPTEPMVLKLAAQDNAANVIYIARPCQYSPLKEDALCSPKYWSSDRFAKEVIDSVNESISNFVVKDEISGVNLIGYSGGGAVAAIVASGRSDILTLRTVAGNLDHVAVNGHHKVTQLKNSLNAIDYADKLSNIPQRHFYGTEDKVVPEFIAKKFAEKSNNSKNCVKSEAVEGADHEHGWIENWKDLLSEPVICENKK